MSWLAWLAAGLGLGLSVGYGLGWVHGFRKGYAIVTQAAEQRMLDVLGFEPPKQRLVPPA